MPPNCPACGRFGKRSYVNMTVAGGRVTVWYCAGPTGGDSDPRHDPIWFVERPDGEVVRTLRDDSAPLRG